MLFHMVNIEVIKTMEKLKKYPELTLEHFLPNICGKKAGNKKFLYENNCL